MCYSLYSVELEGLFEDREVNLGKVNTSIMTCLILTNIYIMKDYCLNLVVNDIALDNCGRRSPASCAQYIV